MISRQLGSLIVGLFIPFIAVIGGIPLFRTLDVSILGFPILYFWMFLWFPLTSVCLWISWYAFDRKKYEEPQENGGIE